jgi:hypothetical protein
MKKLIGLLSLLISLHALAQTDTNAVVVHKDPRIDQLVKKQIEINEFNTRDSRRYISGYRILVVSSNDRNKATNAKSKLYQDQPDLKVYLMYQAPFYKLKAGNFRDRKDAEEYLPYLQKLFPSGVYIIRDTIEVNPADDL